MNSYINRLDFIKFGCRNNIQVMAQEIVHDHPFIDSGETDDSIGFKNKEELNPPFNIKCVDCCFQYLTQIRDYTTVIGNNYQVKYGNAEDWTICYLSGPSKPRGKYSQLKTGKDLNLGQTSERPVQNCLTYQFYTNDRNPGSIALGVPLIARLESIAIHFLQPDHVFGSELNYCNAALLELYRESKSLPSLQGKCERMHEQEHDKRDEDDENPIVTKLEKMTIK